MKLKILCSLSVAVINDHWGVSLLCWHLDWPELSTSLLPVAHSGNICCGLQWSPPPWMSADSYQCSHSVKLCIYVCLPMYVRHHITVARLLGSNVNHFQWPHSIWPDDQPESPVASQRSQMRWPSHPVATGVGHNFYRSRIQYLLIWMECYPSPITLLVVSYNTQVVCKANSLFLLPPPITLLQHSGST